MMEPGFYNMDCMDAMREFPDGFFDLAVVDPPYGDGGGNIGGGGGSADCSTDTRRWNRFGQRFDRYKTAQDCPGGVSRQMAGCQRTGGTWAEKFGKKIIAWDVAPGDDYFRELFRVSRNQIIWGGNYFGLPATRCFLVWDKCQSENFSMAMAEYAWTSFNDNAKMFRMPPMGTAKQPRFHPTQKPVQLYTWILGRYAKPGYKILDTHVGSASSLIACRRAGLEYWGFEIDAQYYAMAKARLDRETAQINIMDVASTRAAEQHAEQVNMLDMFSG